MYQIIFTKPAKKDLKKLPWEVVSKIKNKYLPLLCSDPYIGEPLRGEFHNRWKYSFLHKGTDYRIVYLIFKREVLIEMVGSRESFYKQLRRRIK